GTPMVQNYDQGGAAMNNAAFTLAGSWYWWVAAQGSIFQVPRSGDYRVTCRQQVTNGNASVQTVYLAAAHFPTPSTINVSTHMQTWRTVQPSGGRAVQVTSSVRGGLTGGQSSAGSAWNADGGQGSISINSVYNEITPIRVS